jgi:hypothetical protein
METMEPNQSTPTVVSVSGGGRRTRPVVEVDIKHPPAPVGEEDQSSDTSGDQS